MPFSYGDLTVRGRDGRRVAITNCRLEPLNLFIPGNAPIVVPKKHAWRSPSQQTKMANRSNKPNVESAQDDYEAGSEEDDFDDETQPLIKSSQSRDKFKSRCRKDSMVKEKAKEAKHLRKAESHQKKAELEREEAAGEHERLQKRIAKQEAYILRLKERYRKVGKEAENGIRSKMSTSKKDASNKKKAAESSDSEDGATTDGSAAVREMIANIKIRAGGKEDPRFIAQPGELPWNVSDDSQLITLKEDSSNSYAVIGGCMGRGPGEVKRRYKYLKACDFKIPGGDETTEAEKTGDETTDVEKTEGDTTNDEQNRGDTTDAEKTDDENKDGAGDAILADMPHEQNKGGDDDWTEETDAQLWKLKDDDKTWAEIHAVMDKSKSDLKARYKHLKSIDFKVPDADEKDNSAATAAGDDLMAMASAFVEKQSNETPHQPSPPKRKKSSKSHTTPAASPPSFAGRYDAGTNAYIAQYSRNLLAEANAGRTRIPAPDEVFDEHDCILLALADSRRRENRWLDIQADYFNVTGRMVPQEVLKWKLGAGEKPDHGDEGGY